MGKRNDHNKAFAKAMINSKELRQNIKLKDADQIISRIKWDEKQDKNEFCVGYEDRFLGIMEISFNDFEKSEIPLHRVKYFKKKGEIVWDRTNKIYTL